MARGKCSLFTVLVVLAASSMARASNVTVKIAGSYPGVMDYGHSVTGDAAVGLGVTLPAGNSSTVQFSGPTVTQTGWDFTISGFNAVEQITCCNQPNVGGFNLEITSSDFLGLDVASFTLTLDGVISTSNANGLNVYSGAYFQDNPYLEPFDPWNPPNPHTWYTGGYSAGAIGLKSGEFVLTFQAGPRPDGWKGSTSFMYIGLGVTNLLPGDTFVLPDSLSLHIETAPTSAVPEPASLLLVGAGLVGAAAARRGRKR